MELPECPVCLQTYGGAAVVPRVLPCGHTACELCLSSLPSLSSSLIRCPACNQLVRLPSPLSSLPINFDLLRLFNPPTTLKPPPKTTQSTPPPYFAQSLFDTWNPLILPSDSLTLTLDLTNPQSSLLPISVSRRKSGPLRPSYRAAVLDAIDSMDESAKAELGFLFDASVRQRKSLCRVLGLWMNPDYEKEPSSSSSSPLFLVTERFDRDCGSFRQVNELGSVDEMFRFAAVGMELCEAVIGLHSRGIVCGCLGPGSFCFDEFGHCLLDLSDVLLSARRIQDDEGEDGGSDKKNRVFMSPEVFISLTQDVGDGLSFTLGGSVGYGSDVWCLACVLSLLLLGDAMLEAGLFADTYSLNSKWRCESSSESFFDQYEAWREKVASKLEALLVGTKFDSLLRTLISCLDYRIESRPQAHEVWRCIGDLVGRFCTDVSNVLDGKEKPVCCLALSKLSSHYKNTKNVTRRKGFGNESTNTSDVGSERKGGSSDDDQSQEEVVDSDIVKGLHRGGLKSITLHGHQDCITKLVVGGGFLLSSSFDKTIRVWSLQDYSLVQSLSGHEHKIMAMVVLDGSEPLCISGDSGSGIFVWEIGASIKQEPLQRWYEQKDWRYSGIHSLAASGTEYLYSGSGDKSIKAWSLKDYSLSCTMTGHRSTVSSLAVSDGVLYSGSWDGTIRLWSVFDHGPLSIIGDGAPGSLPPVLAISVNRHLLASSYENGCLKMWRNNELVRSAQIQKGAIFTLHVDTRWLFTGGWDKVVDIQELYEDELHVDIRSIASVSCDSVVTCLLYSQGKLFVGLSNKEIKVYRYGS